MQDSRADAIARLPYVINGTLDLSEVLTRALEQVQVLVEPERTVIVLHDPDDLACRAARGISCSAWETPRFDFARRLVVEVVAEQRARLTSDAQVGQRTDLARSMGIQSILCAPLLNGNECLGALYAERRLTLGIFTADDLDLLETITLYTALAIENARRYGSAWEAGRREGAAQMAESMVLSLLPQETPPVPGFRVAARWQSAGEMSADFYDFFPLADRERWGMVVADVSDRGPPAAVFMALVRSILRGSVTAASDPASGVLQANRLIHADAHPDRYVRAFYSELEATGHVHYVNAGHQPPLWWQARTTTAVSLHPDIPPLGVRERVTPTVHTVRLDHGDVLLLWSDGLSELTNDQGRPFGQERLQALLQQHAHQSASAIAAAILEEARLWLHGRDPHDDVLLVVVKRQPRQTASP